MPLSVGDRLARYEIRAFIGAGGMGEVYRARDERLGRDVAIKVLPEALTGDQDRLQRFEREAQAAAALNHPNIVAVHDIGEHDGRAFIVTELLEGDSLRDVISSGSLTLRRAIELGRQIATGLAAAHDAGITHRDLKPGNLFLTHDGQVKILDFGLAKLARPDTADTEIPTTPIDNAPTETRFAMGTPGYMAPEQLMGQPADQRSDVFAFGVVLYEMMTGTHPFHAQTTTEIHAKILKDEPPDPSRLRPNVPPLLEHLVLRCLQKRPQDRFQSARELLFALEELSTGQVETKEAQRRPSWLRWAAIATAAVAIAIAATVLYQRPSQDVPFKERDWLLITDFENLTDDPTFDNALDPALRVAIEQSTYVNVLSRAAIQPVLEQMLKADADRIDEKLGREVARRRGIDVVLVPSISRLGDRYVLTASLKSAASGGTYASRLVRADDIDGVLPALDRLGREVRSDLGETLASITEHSRPLADVTTSSLEALKELSLALHHHFRSDPAGARKHYAAALAIDPEFTTAKVALAIINLDWGHVLPDVDPERGRELLAEAVTEMDHLTEAERLQILAHHAQFVDGDLERAAEYHNALLAIHPDRPQVHHNLAIIFWRQQRIDDARAEYRRAIELDPNFVVAYEGLLWLLRDEYGEVETMIDWATRELEIADDRPWPYLNLSWALLGKNECERAVDAASKGVEVAPEMVWSHYHLGHVLKCAGEYRAAAQSYDKVLALDPRQIWAHYHAGHVLELAGDRAAARARFGAFQAAVEQAIAEEPDVNLFPIWIDFARIRLGLPPQASFSADQLAIDDPNLTWYLAQLHCLTGRHDEALDLLEHALEQGLTNPIWAFAIPTFDDLRDDPRFQELKRRTLGLDDRPRQPQQPP